MLFLHGGRIAQTADRTRVLEVRGGAARIASMTVAPAVAWSPLEHKQIVKILAGLMVGVFLSALDQTIVATALPQMAADLGGLGSMSWVVTVYLLTSTVTVPLSGKLSDLFGRKRLFQVAIAVFLLGSVLAALAQDMPQMIAFRAIQGAGGGGIMATSMVIVADIVPPRQRGRYQGYMGSVYALASVAGPVLGGFFADQLDWRWVFWINVPLAALAMAVTARVLHLPSSPRDGRHIDISGAALLVAATTCLLLVTVWGGSEHPWSSATIVMLAVVSLASFVGFVLVERRAEEPILPLHLFEDPVFAIGVTISFLVSAVMFGAIVYLPLFLQAATGESATDSGALLLPLTVAIPLAVISSGRFMTRTGRYKPLPLVGMAAAAVATYLLSTMDAGTTRATSVVYMAILGIGIGLVLQTVVVAIQNAVDRHDLGVATASVNFVRTMGGMIWVAVLGTILSSRVRSEFRAIAPAGIRDRIDPVVRVGDAAGEGDVPAAAADALRAATEAGLQDVFLATVPVAVVAFALALVLRELPLRETFAVAMEGEILLPDAAPGANPLPPPQDHEVEGGSAAVDEKVADG